MTPILIYTPTPSPDSLTTVIPTLILTMISTPISILIITMVPTLISSLIPTPTPATRIPMLMPTGRPFS